VAAGGSRAMRKFERGTVLSWDFQGAPTVPWVTSPGTPAQVGQARLLIGVD